MKPGEIPFHDLQSQYKAVKASIDSNIKRVIEHGQNTVFCDDRERMRRIPKERGVPTAVHYPVPLSDQPPYRGLVRASALPVTANSAQSVLSLPMHADLDEATQDNVVACIVEAFGASRIVNGACKVP